MGKWMTLTVLIYSSVCFVGLNHMFYSTDSQQLPSYPTVLNIFLCLSVRLNILLHGMTPLYFHIVNVCLHCAVTCLLMHTCERCVFEDCHLAFVTALLFTVHPVHTEAVSTWQIDWHKLAQRMCRTEKLTHYHKKTKRLFPLITYKLIFIRSAVPCKHSYKSSWQVQQLIQDENVRSMITHYWSMQRTVLQSHCFISILAYTIQTPITVGSYFSPC